MLASSPVGLSRPSLMARSRPGLGRTVSTLSERTPLSDVPAVVLPPTGEALLLGRSSSSSHYQLSANRLISRVHVSATRLPPCSSHPAGRVQIECLGWNGATVHYRGQAQQLAKGDVFWCDGPDADLMVDVQETRVMVRLQDRVTAGGSTDASWSDAHASSPPLLAPRGPHSPVSPSPCRRGGVLPSQLEHSSLLTSSPSLVRTFVDLPEHGAVQVYEDSGEDEAAHDGGSTPTAARVRKPCRSPKEVRSSLQAETSLLLAAANPMLQPLRSSPPAGNSPSRAVHSSLLSSMTSSDDYSDKDEENDPIIHSFGPFGANILPRLESFTASSPEQPRPRQTRKLRTPSGSPRTSHVTTSSVTKKSPAKAPTTDSPVRNHVINQLAFSRLHAMPLSLIWSNLPKELKDRPMPVTLDEKSRMQARESGHVTAPSASASAQPDAFTEPRLQILLEGIACVGVIARSGKDAAGKPLESEFYYVPEMDADVLRRDAVLAVRGTGLRAVRRNHKVSASCDRLICRYLGRQSWMKMLGKQQPSELRTRMMFHHRVPFCHDEAKHRYKCANGSSNTIGRNLDTKLQVGLTCLTAVHPNSTNPVWANT